MTSHLHPPSDPADNRGLLSAGLLSQVFVSRFESLRPAHLFMLVAIIERRRHLSKKQRIDPFTTRTLNDLQIVVFFFVFFLSPERTSSNLQSFQLLTENCSGFARLLGPMLDSLPFVSDLLLPLLLVRPIPGPSCHCGRQGNSWMASQGGQEASLTEYCDDERISAVSFFSRVGSALEKTRLILSSVNGGDSAEQKWLLSHFTYIKWDQCRRFGAAPLDCLVGFTTR